MQALYDASLINIDWFIESESLNWRKLFCAKRSAGQKIPTQQNFNQPIGAASSAAAYFDQKSRSRCGCIQCCAMRRESAVLFPLRNIHGIGVKAGNRYGDIVSGCRGCMASSFTLPIDKTLRFNKKQCLLFGRLQRSLRHADQS